MGGASKQGKVFINFRREELSSNAITVMLIISLISKLSAMSTSLARHFLPFVQLPNPRFLLSLPLPLHTRLHDPLLKRLQMTDWLFVEVPPNGLPPRRDGGDLERFRLATPSNKVMPITVQRVQNLPWNSGGITHCFGLVGCWATM